MDSHTMIQALIYLGAAALIVPVAVRLGLGSVLGYLIAGCVIGPWGFRLVTDAESILHFAEIGVVLMLIYVLFFTDFFDGEKKRKKNEKKAEASHE